MFGRRGYESNESPLPQAPSGGRARSFNFPRNPFQKKEQESLRKRNTEEKRSILGTSRSERMMLIRDIEKEADQKKPKYELSLELDTKKSPEIIEKQKAALNSLTERQRQLFEKKGLVAGMYSLSAEQRKQFEESGISREFRGQAEEKMAAYFGYEGHKNINYEDLPKSIKRDMLLGNLYMDDFLPENIRTQLSADITTIKKLQRKINPENISTSERETIFETAKELRNRYDIQPEDFQEYLREGGQDNGLLSGLFYPLLQSLAPTQLTELGVDNVENFRQRNIPVFISSGGNEGSGGSVSYSSGGSSVGGYSEGTSGRNSSFSTPSISSSVTDIPDPIILSSLPGNFKTNLGFWEANKVAEVRRNGGIWINMDCNQSSGRKVIPPLIVIPDDSSPEIRAAAKAYVDAMTKLHNEKFGRNFSGQVKTRGQNGRGRPDTIHTEAWSIDDTQMVEFLKSEEGIQQYREILASTLGKIPGAVFSLPHGERDPGAVNSQGDSEVSLAKVHLNGFSAESEKTSQSSDIAAAPLDTKTATGANAENPSTTISTEEATKYYGPQT